MCDALAIKDLPFPGPEKTLLPVALLKLTKVILLLLSLAEICPA